MLFSLEKVPKPAFRSKKIILLNALSLISLSLFFWLWSRYPQIFQKAAMADRIPLSGIGFDTLINPNEHSHFVIKMFVLAINWYYTNWKGMVFGLCFASLAMSLLTQIKIKYGQNNFLNAIYGSLTGTPLGVCTNCAAPIGEGTFLGGFPRVSSITLLMSSPVFNFVIISALFSIFPPSLAWLKIAANAVMIFVFTPLIFKIFDKSESLVNDLQDSIKTLDSTWTASAKELTRGFFLNLFYLSKITVPFMLVAGILGSLTYLLLPAGGLSEITPSNANLFLISIFGVLAPVPMMFDLLLSIALLSNGLHLSLVASLLFSLGGTSVYALYIGNKISNIKITATLFCTFVLLSFGVGKLTIYLEENKIIRAVKGMTKIINIENRQVMANAKNIIEDKCKILSNPKEINNCYNKHLSSFISIRARQKVDISFCNFHWNKSHKESCLYDVVVDLALYYKNPYLCNQYFKGKKTYRCSYEYLNRMRGQKVWFIKQVFQTEKSCTEYYTDSVLKHLCVSVLATSKASDLKDSSFCEVILPPKLKDLCIQTYEYNLKIPSSERKCDYNSEKVHPDCRSILLTQFVKGKSTINDCSKFTKKLAKKDCQATFMTLKAVITGDPKTCDSFVTDKDKQFCLNHVLMSEINNKLLGTGVNILPNKHKVDPNFVGWKKPFPKAKVKNEATLIISKEEFNVFHLNLNKRKSSATTLFDVKSGKEIGITHPIDFDLKSIYSPFSMGTSMATGFINNDLFPDIVLPLRNKVMIFFNDGKGSFESYTYSHRSLMDKHFIVAATVDLNNDNRSDLVLAGYGQELFVILNYENRFGEPKVIKLSEEIDFHVMSLSFHDLDSDGDLDMVVGTWPESNTLKVMNNTSNFNVKSLGDFRGKTLSTLISDINSDGGADLFIGNDWEVPDVIFPNFLKRKKSRGFSFPHSSFYTMSLDSADVNNDLTLDYLSVDMSFEGRTQTKDYCQFLTDEQEKEVCQKTTKISWLAQKNLIDECVDLGPLASDCATAVIKNMTGFNKNPILCGKIPLDRKIMREMCFNRARSNFVHKYSKSDLKQEQRNVLLINKDNKAFEDRTKEWRIESSSWTWNSKFSDFNNDTYQDLLVVNGFNEAQEVTPNILYLNLKGTSFIKNKKLTGIDDYIQTNTFTITDFDLDGDMDVVTNGYLSRPRIYQNSEDKNNFIRLNLKNSKMSPIGSKVVIRYGDDNSQIRELKRSGGFLSFDEMTLHFGLGNHKQINSFEIHWPDGSRTFSFLPLLANQLYIIEKKN